MSIPKEFLNDLRSHIFLSSLASKYTTLYPRTKNYKGLTPFQCERNPSFIVNDNVPSYCCYSTGNHGEHIDLIMNVEKITYFEAIDYIAGLVGYTFPSLHKYPYDEKGNKRRLIYYKKMYNTKPIV